MTTTPTDATAADASRLAAGSSLVFVGGLVDKAVRLVTTWFLSGALGAAGFGVYALATTVATVAMSLAPLGTDAGVTMYGARFWRSGELSRLKGTLLVASLTSVIGGMVAAAALWLVGRQGILGEELSQVLFLIACAVVVGSPMGVACRVLQATRFMRDYTVANLVLLPVSTLVVAVLAVWSGGSIQGALVGFAVGHGLTLLAATFLGLWRLSHVLLDRAVHTAATARELLRYSLPQSLSKTLWRLNVWTDLLMLGWLAAASDVGTYRVALSVAMLGTLPVMAVTTVFSPTAASMVYEGQHERLDALLKAVTRVLVLLLTPLYVGLCLLPDVALSIFGDAYTVGATALVTIVVGQAVYLATAPTNALIAMAGYARLNLINNLAAVLLNAALNYAFIPRWGIEGAALASALALAVWSIARAIQVKLLLGCFAFDLRTGAVALAAAVSLLLVMGLDLTSPWARAGGLVAALAVVGATLALTGLTDLEKQLLSRLARSVGARTQGNAS